jgi:hypothetical protein
MLRKDIGTCQCERRRDLQDDYISCTSGRGKEPITKLLEQHPSRIREDCCINSCAWTGYTIYVLRNPQKNIYRNIVVTSRSETTTMHAHARGTSFGLREAACTRLLIDRSRPWLAHRTYYQMGGLQDLRCNEANLRDDDCTSSVPLVLEEAACANRSLSHYLLLQ